MSLQDDIFDLEAHLEGNAPLTDAFDRICTKLDELDEENETLRSDKKALVRTLGLVRKNGV